MHRVELISITIKQKNYIDILYFGIADAMKIIVDVFFIQKKRKDFYLKEKKINV